MKEIKNKLGEKELQPAEHVPRGPVRLTDPMIPVILARLKIIDEQIASLQMSAARQLSK